MEAVDSAEVAGSAPLLRGLVAGVAQQHPVRRQRPVCYLMPPPPGFYKQMKKTGIDMFLLSPGHMTTIITGLKLSIL